MRLSISAIQDYNRCPAYYKFRRIDKLKVPETHHMAAGSIMHDVYYMAYGRPVDLVDHGSHLKPQWEVHGDFTPDAAHKMFHALWWGNPPGGGELANAYGILSQTRPPPEISTFVRGPTKALKVESKAELKKNWGKHYASMLKKCLEEPLSLPVIEIERPIEYSIGNSHALGYIDLVLRDEENDGEVFVDLKSGYNKPTTEDLYFDAQMAAYYRAEPIDIWYYHMRSGEIIAVDKNLFLVHFMDANAKEVAEAIEANYFPKRFTKDCVRCPFRAHCIGI